MKSLLLLALAAGLSGCTTLPLPPEAAGITLTTEPSAAIAFYPPKFVSAGGSLELAGYVYRAPYARSTAHSHLDITFLGAGGRALRRETAEFSPHDLRAKTPRTLPQPGHYRVLLSPLPAGTVKIEVRAHDGPHAPAT